MAIHQWWAGDADERYWVEITDRPLVGADLWAPTLNRAGRAEWGYELVTYTKPGDLVLHWHKHYAALIGWSVVAGGVQGNFEEWQPHGSYGRSAPRTGLRPVWQIPLTSYTTLASPVTQATVREHEAELKRVCDRLLDAHGKPIYFPFAFSDKRPMRAAQAYFTKWPSALIQILGLATAVAAAQIDVPDVVARSGQQVGSDEEPPNRARRTSSTGGGFVADPVLRKAIEMHAVGVATLWYEDADYEVDYTGDNKPYDLVAIRGTEERRVEVKGSTGDSELVILTRNEISHAQEDFAPVDLFVVDCIDIERARDGRPVAMGGRSRRWPDWQPDDARLRPIQYHYELDRGHQSIL